MVAMMEGVMSDFTQLRTVKQVAQLNPAFSESSLRWLIFRSDFYGFAPCVVRVRRRVLIDVDQFNKWIDTHRSSSAAA